MKKLLGIIVLGLLLSGNANAENVNIGTAVSCDSDAIILPDKVKKVLMETEMTQCAMPFGVLIAADKKMNKNYVNLLASIVAEFLDQNRDGIPDDPKLHEILKNWKKAWLAMPTSPKKWEKKQIPKISKHLGYNMIAPKWWMGNKKQTKAMLVEEAFHLITQFGLSKAYPKKFGVENWESTIAKETKLAACKWWQHPENSCKKKYKGGCKHPNCDVTEFFQQVVILRAGMKPGWYGIGFPKNKKKLEKSLSNEMKELLDDNRYHIINKPLQFDYYK